MTLSKPVAEVRDTDVVQLVVHGALFPGLVNWLQLNGFEVSPFPRPDDDLDTYMVQPTRARLEASGFFDSVGPPRPAAP